jgi:hypothetical protein
LVWIAFFFAAASMAQTSGLISAQTDPAVVRAKPTGVDPRTPDGHPDFQGIWNNGTLTPLERGIAPKVVGGLIPLPPVTTLTIADSEATAYEQRLRTIVDFKPGDRSEGDLSGELNPAFLEYAAGLARVNGSKRTSLIVDPADGRIPYIATEKERNSSRAPERFDSVKDRSLNERCLPNGGTPIMAFPFDAFYQIGQTPDYVMIMSEYLHQARIVRIGRQHPPSGVRQWLGDSIGYWEGDTLVVDTTNFNAQTKFQGASENLHVVERFKPIDGDTLLYRATVEDPSVFSRPWVFEYPFRRASGPIYEDACHEGNYALPNILKGARKAEADSAKQ